MSGFDPISAIAAIIEKIIPDKAAAQAAKDTLFANRESNDIKLALAQIGVNTEDAKSSRVFIAGWRPALAWVCLADVVFETIVIPFVSGWYTVHSANALSVTMPILVTLIGARTVDKWQGTDTK